MSDQNGAGQTRPTALPIVINAQYVKDFSFENPNAPQTLLPGQPAPQVSVGVDVRSQQVGETLYEVVLEMRCEAKIAENTAFLVELSYAGLFTVTGLAEEHIKPVLLIEAPRLLFPFARAIARGFEDHTRVASVSHWGFIRAMTGHEVDNCAVVEFDPESGSATCLARANSG